MYSAGMIEVSRFAWLSAVSWFNRALEIDPAMTKAYVSLALSLAELRLFEEAIETLQKARGIGTHLREIENAVSNIHEMKSGTR